MALSINSHLRRLAAPRLWPLRASTRQRRLTQAQYVRCMATAEPSQTILEKYRAKLDKKAKEEGLKDLEELKAAYADKISDLRRKDAVELPSPPPPISTPSPSKDSTAPPAPPASSIDSPLTSPTPSSSNAPAVKPLSAILDLEKARALPDKELTAIWRLRHAHSPLSLCAVIPSSTYLAMEAAARSAPQFVLPVPHPEQGAEIHFLQWSFDAATNTSTVLFTQLAEYKARGEFAQPHTTVTHHTDLIGERGLVLMQGQVVEGRGAKVEDAHFLVMCLQKFYGGWEAAAEGKTAEERNKLLEWFAKGDARFTIEKLMEETERMV